MGWESMSGGSGAPTATDIADPGVVATCVPSSGSVFAVGATVVTCSATDASGNTGSDTLTVTVELDTDSDGIPNRIDPDDDNDGILDTVEGEIGTDPLVVNVGRQFKQAVRDYVEGFNGTRWEDDRTDRAIRALDKSLEDRNWIDDDSLTDKYGKKVFSEEKKAVKELQRIVKRGGTLASGAQTAIDVLVFVDRQLATTLIGEIPDGADADDVADALRHLDRGDTYADRGRPDKAIKEYEKAWKDAGEAIEEYFEDLDDDD